MKRTNPVRSILVAASVTVLSGLFAAWLVGTTPRAFGRADTTPQSKPASQPDAASQPADDNTRYMRVVDKPGRSMALEIAVRTYKRPDGKGPEVSLVGVMHIGDHNYYQTLQKLLETFSVVLYESVRPPGTDPTQGKNDEERAENTKAALGFLSGAVQAYEKKTGALPTDLDQVTQFAKDHDVRLGHWVAQAATDGWGHLVHYAIADDGKSFTIRSFGSDNAQGGSGSAADLQADKSSDPLPLSGGDDPGLQSELASALGLEFQLNAIDYGRDNWRCADMSVDRVERELKNRGSDFTVLAGTLAGSSFPAKIVKLLLHMMKVVDSMTDGAVTDMFKIMMIQMLADPAALEGIKQFGPGFSEVIVGLRNQTVVDDLKTLIASEPNTPSVAIFYGAAHMTDMAQKLKDQLGYEPADKVQWFSAITVDIAHSSLDPAEVRQMRMMMRQMLHQMRTQSQSD